MVDETVSLRIAAMFVLFFASFAGITIPLYGIKTNLNTTLPILNAASAGVMMGLALIHLMPEADEMLKELVPDYPLANCLTGVGIICVLYLEQLSVMLHKPPAAEESNQRLLSTDVFMHLKHEHTESTDHEHNHGTLPFSDILVANSLRDIINAYALEISTAIHSIVIGFDLGVLHDSGDVGTIVMLTIVLSVHQFIEGLGLGAVIKTSEARLGNSKVLTFILIFCSTVSLGVFLGLVAAPSEESDTQLAIEGGATALASGSLLYISLVDMTSHYFNLPSLEDQKSTKLTMLLVFALGASILGIIGIWA